MMGRKLQFPKQKSCKVAREYVQVISMELTGSTWKDIFLFQQNLRSVLF